MASASPTKAEAQPPNAVVEYGRLEAALIDMWHVALKRRIHAWIHEFTAVGYRMTKENREYGCAMIKKYEHLAKTADPRIKTYTDKYGQPRIRVIASNVDVFYEVDNRRERHYPVLMYNQDSYVIPDD